MRLFEPILLRNLEVKNRIVMPSMTTRLGTSDGSVTNAHVEYYAERARGGVGLLIVEMSGVDPSGKHRDGELGVYDRRFIPGLRRLSDTVKAHETRVCIQIAHAGGYTTPRVTGLRTLAPSSLPYLVFERFYETVMSKEMSVDEIQHLVKRFGEAAEVVKEAGFDAVEVHGAHGYLIFQFLSPLTNKRRDEYGGGLNGRAKFALEVVEEVRRCVGDFPVIFRYSAEEYAENGFTLHEGLKLARMMEEAGVDALHISAGSYRSFSPVYMIPSMAWPKACYAHLAERVKREVKIPVIAVGRIHDPAVAKEIVEKARADMVAVGRALIADPQWPNKVREERTKSIRMCIACNTCVDTMREGGSIVCSINPEAGRESLLKLEPAENRKRVVVVGGGPSGMEASRILAERGHKVTLFEKNTQLGGNLLTASKAPVFQNVEAVRETILSFVNYLSNQLTELKVDVKLNVKVGYEDILRIKPDCVILAAGAEYYPLLNFFITRLLDSRLPRTRCITQILLKKRVKRILNEMLRRPKKDLFKKLKEILPELYLIGDSRKPRRLVEAVYEGSMVGRRI